MKRVRQYQRSVYFSEETFVRWYLCKLKKKLQNFGLDEICSDFSLRGVTGGSLDFASETQGAVQCVLNFVWKCTLQT